jgi:hypothetical protein
MVSSFKKFLHEIHQIQIFDDYLTFLTENSILSLPQTSNWGTIKQGFDQVKDPIQRKKIAKEGRKTRKAKLLGKEGSNPKLAKESETVPEYMTKGLSLSPSTESGRINTCSCATAECKAACLNKAGRGAMTSTQVGRLKKTNLMIDAPHHFMGMLHDEIDTHEKSAAKKRKRAAVRLNVVSDIPHERLHPEIFSQHPNVQFYDYTKVARRVLKPDGSRQELPHNYHLTLSSTGIHREGNWKDARQHLDNGGVVAMVFGAPAARGKKLGGALPTHVHDERTGRRYRVIDGDAHDHRHLDHVYSGADPGEGLIAGLRIKGGKKMLAKAGDFAVKIPLGQTHVSVPDIHH